MANIGVHLLPAAIVVLLLADIVSGAIGAIVAFGTLLMVPGWLVWKLLGGPLTREPLALPAVWVVLSFTLLSPALAVMVYVGGPALTVELYALVALLVLGAAASQVPAPPISALDRRGVGVIALAAAGMTYRFFTWSASGDELTFLGYIRATFLGSYPASNPFMAGDLPLNPRWRFGGWTGATGVISHLGDTDPELVMQTILPTLLVAVVASAMYLFVKAFSADERLSLIAAAAALVVPLITSTSGKTDLKFAYRVVEFDKFTTMLIFAPVAAGLLIALYRSRRWPMGILTGAVLWSSLWVHAVMTVLAVLAFVGYTVLDRFFNRPSSWRLAAGACLLAATPLLLTAAAASLTEERFGTLAGDVEDLSDIAYPGRAIGPIRFWVPRPIGSVRDVALEDAAVVFSRGYINTTEGPVVVFLSNGWPMAHPDILANPRYLLVALAVLIILFGRHRDPIALWILATAAVGLSVYVLPPVAALAARVVTPWQLYRFAWLMPVPLSVAWLIGRWLRASKYVIAGGIAVGLTIGIVFTNSSHASLLRTGPPPAADRLAAAIDELEGREGVLMASRDVMNAAASRWPDVDAVSFRGLSSMSNGFSFEQQQEAFQRFQDARSFFRDISTAERSAILERYQIDLIIIEQDEAATLGLDILGFEPAGVIGQRLVLYERIPPPLNLQTAEQGGAPSR